ncbi:MAG TPA: tubulin-like doman-containing protein, partial [Chloroflexia bacterium]
MPETKLNLYPTMVIGLGGTGTNVVRLAKRRFMRTWNGALAQRRSQLAAQGLPIATLEDVEDLPPMLQVLAVDTEPRTNRPLEEPLYHHEFAFLGKFDATKLVRNKDQHPYLGTWWKWNENGQEEIPLGFIHTGAKQLRPIGRLAYFRHYVSFKDVLRKKLVAMLDVPAIEQAQNNYISVNTDQRVIYIVSSVCGGTGAGMFIDVAHTVRHYASELFSGKSNIHIVGVFLMPSVFENEVRSALQRRRIRANAFAALRELNHFHTHQDFKAWYPSEQQPIPTTPYRAFNQIFIVERDDVNGKSLSTKAAAEQMVAQLVHLTTFSTLNSTIFGQDVNVTEERKANAASGGRSYLAYSSFGASALVMPRVALWRYFVAQTTGWALSNFFIDRSDPQPLMGIYKKLIDDLKSEFNKHYESSKKNKSTKALEALAADMGENTGRWTPLRGYFEEAMRSALSNLQDAGMGGLWLFLQAILAPEGNARPGWLTHPATIP